MAATRLLLWGAPLLRHGTQELPLGAERRSQLLAYLGLHSGQWVARDRLASLFWADRETSEARRNLRKVLFRAREMPGTERLESNEHAVRWTVTSDLQAFNEACHHGTTLEALRLARGELLAGLDDATPCDFNEWLAGERRSWNAAWQQAAADGLRTARDPAQRLQIAQQLWRADPLNEAAVETLLRAAMASGHPAHARRLYLDYAEALAAQLGVEPSHALRDLLAETDRATAADSGVERAVARLPHAPSTSSFIGRRLELSQLSLMVGRETCRLITLLARLSQLAVAFLRFRLFGLCKCLIGKGWDRQIACSEDLGCCGVLRRFVECSACSCAAPDA